VHDDVLARVHSLNLTERHSVPRITETKDTANSATLPPNQRHHPAKTIGRARSSVHAKRT
jgi:hypothetical protein